MRPDPPHETAGSVTCARSGIPYVRRHDLPVPPKRHFRTAMFLAGAGNLVESDIRARGRPITQARIA